MSTSSGSTARRERRLRLLLRWVGSASLLALLFVPVPLAWMAAIHRALGMGDLPARPVVGYLARSTSAFYALLGLMFWVMSFDLPRYRPLLRVLGATIAAFGLGLVCIDWLEGMPWFWALAEGPFVAAMGLAIHLLSREPKPRP